MPFVGNPRENIPVGLPFKLTDYLELVELTGRAIRHDKKGYIEKHQPPILQRLGIEVESWMKMTTSFETTFKDLVGNPTLWIQPLHCLIENDDLVLLTVRPC
jgi:hypothetical protein